MTYFYESAEARPLLKPELHCDCSYCGAKAGEKCRVVSGETTGKPAGKPHHARRLKYTRREYDVPMDYHVFNLPEDIPRPKSQLFSIDVIYEPDGIAHEDFMDALEKLREQGAAVVTRHDQLENTVNEAYRIARSKARTRGVEDRW